jgi:hypothetical protein
MRHALGHEREPTRKSPRTVVSGAFRTRKATSPQTMTSAAKPKDSASLIWVDTSPLYQRAASAGEGPAYFVGRPAGTPHEAHRVDASSKGEHDLLAPCWAELAPEIPQISGCHASP